MNNADMPAMPQDYALWCESIGDCPTLATGLTKREYFAAMAMQGLCDNLHPKNVADMPKLAVIIADALLKELNNAH